MQWRTQPNACAVYSVFLFLFTIILCILFFIFIFMVKYNDGILFVILTSERVFFMQKIKNVFGAYAEPAILVANLYLIIDLK